MKNSEGLVALRKLSVFDMCETELDIEVAYAIEVNKQRLRNSLGAYIKKREELEAKYIDNGRADTIGLSNDKDIKKLDELELEVDIMKVGYDSVPKTIKPKYMAALFFMIDIDAKTAE